MSGKPKPTNLKVFEGNRGKRPLPEKEPEPNAVIPKRPTDLDSGAKKIWKELSPKLFAIGLLTEADGENFAALCQIISRLKKIRKKINSSDFDDSDTRKLLVEERLFNAQLRQFASEFGITPRGRVGLKGKKTKEKDTDLI